MEKILEIATQIGIDETFFYIFGLVALLYFALSYVYLRPFQKLLHERKEKTEGVKKEAAELLTLANEKMEIYNEYLRDTQGRVRMTLAEHEEEARKQEAKALSETSEKVKKRIQQVQADLESQRPQIHGAVSKEIELIAESIATKILGRPLT